MSRRFRTLSLLLVVGIFQLLTVLSSSAVTLTSQEQALANLLTNSSKQNRPFMRLDPILTQVARSRAADMAKRGYFAHVNPDGNGPNYLVEKAGYRLPDSWGDDRKANYIESVAAGGSSASTTWSDWMGSSSHKTHLLAETSFYEDQTSYGVGYVSDAGSDYKHYWVVITAPPNIVAPKVTISSPAASARLTAPSVTISGTASGTTLPQSVQVRVDNAAGTGTYRNASGTTSWSVAVADLAPGTNTIRVRSLNSSGAVLAETARVVTYAVLHPLVVNVSGEGKVTAGFLGETSREAGRKYTIAATPAAGWLFQGWSGGVSQSGASISFVMAEGMQLTATFVPNPFLTQVGTYSGVSVVNGSAEASTTGLLRVTVGSTGKFTGKFTLGGVAYSTKGQFGVDGAATVTIRRNGREPLVLDLHLDLSGGGGISGTVTDGTFVAEVSSSKAFTTAAGAFEKAGRYTILMPGNPAETSASVPKGDGYATLVVDKRGRARMAGSLADGRSFTQSGTFSATGELEIYVPLYSKTGVLAGQVAFRETSVSDLDGTVFWTKPARPQDAIHPAAFQTQTPVVGSRYTVPSRGATVVSVATAEGNSTLLLGDGNLETPVAQPVTLDTTNRVRVTNPELAGLKLTVTSASGTFSGSFKHPVTGKTSTLRGVIFQKQNAGYGYFLGSSESGYSSFAPGSPSALQSAAVGTVVP